MPSRKKIPMMGAREMILPWVLAAEKYVPGTQKKLDGLMATKGICPGGKAERLFKILSRVGKHAALFLAYFMAFFGLTPERFKGECKKNHILTTGACIDFAVRYGVDFACMIDDIRQSCGNVLQSAQKIWRFIENLPGDQEKIWVLLKLISRRGQFGVVPYATLAPFSKITVEELHNWCQTHADLIGEIALVIEASADWMEFTPTLLAWMSSMSRRKDRECLLTVAICMVENRGAQVAEEAVEQAADLIMSGISSLNERFTEQKHKAESAADLARIGSDLEEEALERLGDDPDERPDLPPEIEDNGRRKNAAERELEAQASFYDA